jgi:cell wall-associated NlpC family hydrolase
MPMLLGACTVVGTGVRPTPGAPPAEGEPAPAAEPSRSVENDVPHADRTRARLVEIAVQSIGTPYEWGGTDANGFDCSGLIQFAYGKLGIRLPRMSTAQMRAGSPVAPEAELLRPGDLLGFSTDESRLTSHVGLYIGEDEFIHSSSTGVRISTLRSSYWHEQLVAVRRIVE